MTHLVVDAHEDLAWNMLTFGRDYRRSAFETRRLEVDSATPQHNGDSLLGWPEYQQGNVAIVFSTIYVAPSRCALGAWDTQAYRTFEQARRYSLAQMDAYHRLAGEHPDQFCLIRSRVELESHLALWDQPAAESGHPVGLVVLMENAEGVRAPDELGEWWELGLRIIGPAWAGTRFCGGTNEPGPLTRDGYALLDAMSEIGFTLDLSHMDREAALQALDHYPGPLIASHVNPLAMLKGSESNRHLSDEVIDGIFERDGVVGVVPCNPFLKPGWSEKDGRQVVSMQLILDHVDYYCQRAGDARHVGIGSDFDGGFGLQRIPAGMNSIADLQKLAPILERRGYNSSDISAVLGGNWLQFLRRGLPL